MDTIEVRDEEGQYYENYEKFGFMRRDDVRMHRRVGTDNQSNQNEI